MEKNMKSWYWYTMKLCSQLLWKRENNHHILPWIVIFPAWENFHLQRFQRVEAPENSYLDSRYFKRLEISKEKLPGIIVLVEINTPGANTFTFLASIRMHNLEKTNSETPSIVLHLELGNAIDLRISTDTKVYAPEDECAIFIQE